MKLTEATAKALALDAKEAADAGDISNSDIRRWLSDALNDIRADMDGYCWCYLTDFVGDGESGTVYFCCDGDLTAAPYTITQTADSISVEIDMEQAMDVVQATTYKREGNEAMAMEAKGRMKALAAKFKKGKASVAKDAKAATEKPTAEAGRTQEAGARHSKVDQGLIQNIHDHAIALGAVSPSNNDNNVEESAAVAGKGMRLCESAKLSTAFEFREAAALSPTVKIISEGRGSSGYYTKEVLKRDGPGVFGRGTLMFVNHATEAERIARPEGDWSKLAAVTEGPAEWQDAGPDGPGLYAPAAVFSKFAEEVREKAPYTGVSINAFGLYAESATGEPNPDVKFSESKKAPDGKPGLIGKLTFAESIDLVTKAGRDGKLLLESASQLNHQQETSMAEGQQLTEAEVKQFREQAAEIRKLKEQAAITQAAGAVAEYFRSVRVPSQAIVERVTARVLAGSIPLTESGDLDRAKVKTFAESQLNEELEFLKRINPSLVTGMGTAPTQMSEAQIEKRQKREKEALLESTDRFARVMGFGGDEHKIGRKILREGRDGFDVHYNARTRGREVSSELGSLGLEA